MSAVEEISFLEDRTLAIAVGDSDPELLRRVRNGWLCYAKERGGLDVSFDQSWMTFERSGRFRQVFDQAIRDMRDAAPLRFLQPALSA